MDYVYDVQVSVFSGIFGMNKVGKVGFKAVHFQNPIQKRDLVEINTAEYCDRMGRRNQGVYVGKVKDILHVGRFGDDIEPFSTIYTEYKERSLWVAKVQFDEMKSLEKLLKTGLNAESKPVHAETKT